MNIASVWQDMMGNPVDCSMHKCKSCGQCVSHDDHQPGISCGYENGHVFQPRADDFTKCETCYRLYLENAEADMPEDGYPEEHEIHQPIVPIVFSGYGSRARFSSGIVEFCRFHSCSREVGDLIAKAALPNSPSQVRAMTQHNLGFGLRLQSIAYNPIFKLYLGHRLGFNH